MKELKFVEITGMLHGVKIYRSACCQQEGFLIINELARIGCVDIMYDFDAMDNLSKTLSEIYHNAQNAKLKEYGYDTEDDSAVCEDGLMLEEYNLLRELYIARKKFDAHGDAYHRGYYKGLLTALRIANVKPKYIKLFDADAIIRW